MSALQEDPLSGHALAIIAGHPITKIKEALALGCSAIGVELEEERFLQPEKKLRE